MRSIILVSTGVMDIGLKSERQPGVAVLGTGHIEACFHWRGTVAVAIDWLKRRASGLQKIGAQRRRNQAGSWSGPVAVVRSLSRIMNMRHSVTTSVQRLPAVSFRGGAQ